MWLDIWDSGKGNYIYSGQSFIKTKRYKNTHLHSITMLLVEADLFNFETNAYIRAVIEYSKL